MSLMTCPRCGSAAADAWAFCRNCGTEMPDPDPPPVRGTCPACGGLTFDGYCLDDFCVVPPEPDWLQQEAQA